MQEPARFVGAVDSFRGTGMLRGVLGERLRRDRLFQLGGRFLLGTDSQGRAAQALGALDRRVLLRHLLPNVRTRVIISATPGIAIGLAVLGFNLGGDALRVAHDPRLRNER